MRVMLVLHAGTYIKVSRNIKRSLLPPLASKLGYENLKKTATLRLLQFSTDKRRDQRDVTKRGMGNGKGGWIGKWKRDIKTGK